MTSKVSKRCNDLLLELGLLQQGAPIEVYGLTGGVASDIAVVKTRDRSYCAKFALPKLKVESDWFAPVHRNAAEYAWLAFAAEIAPDNAVRIYGRSEVSNGFVMEYVEGDSVYLWKAALLDQQAPRGEAAKVGSLLGRLHAGSTKVGFKRGKFQNREDFHALRIEPYLVHSAQRNPEVMAGLHDLAQMLDQSDQVLVHGDVSPKNILFQDGKAVVLDAECATMGDASFDPAFCLNHLALKAIHMPEMRWQLFQEVIAFWKAYSAHVSWEPTSDLETRICRLLPALMLARVDGKSPVEYLSDEDQQAVRKVAKQEMMAPKAKLGELMNSIGAALKNTPE